MKKIILTGFEPFGPYKYNPTQQSAIDFDGKTIGDREVIGLILPSTYDAWGCLASLIQRTNADAVISTGLSSSVKGIRIESTFRNLMWGKYPDANGYTPDNVAIMDENVPYEIKSKAPHQKMLRLLHANGIPAELSNDADTFMCNALGYKTSLAARKTGCPTRNIFIHIPWTTEYQDRVVIEKEKIFLPSDLYYKGLELLIRNI